MGRELLLLRTLLHLELVRLLLLRHGTREVLRMLLWLLLELLRRGVLLLLNRLLLVLRALHLVAAAELLLLLRLLLRSARGRERLRARVCCDGTRGDGGGGAAVVHVGKLRVVLLRAVLGFQLGGHGCDAMRLAHGVELCTDGRRCAPPGPLKLTRAKGAATGWV